MRGKNLLITALLVMAATACSSEQTSKTPNKYTTQQYDKKEMAQESAAAYYAVLEFDKGTQNLSESSKKSLKDFIATAKKEGKPIDDIKILAWADKEYPTKKGLKLSKKDVSMAKERSKAIEKYLKEDLKIDGDYATYNMAKRPNKVNEFFRGDDYKTKKVYGQPEAAPVDGQLNALLKDKAGKALIMLDYTEKKWK